MKLKFEKEVEDILNSFSQLPDTATEEEDLNKPFKIISTFDKKLLKQKNENTLPTKQWVKLRRQLSFLYEIVVLTPTESKKLVDPKLISEKEYQLLVKSLKDIQSNKALQNPGFIKIALRYGIVYLSDFEIQSLIDNNNKRSN